MQTLGSLCSLQNPHRTLVSHFIRHTGNHLKGTKTNTSQLINEKLSTCTTEHKTKHTYEIKLTCFKHLEQSPNLLNNSVYPLQKRRPRMIQTKLILSRVDQELTNSRLNHTRVSNTKPWKTGRCSGCSRRLFPGLEAAPCSQPAPTAPTVPGLGGSSLFSRVRDTVHTNGRLCGWSLNYKATCTRDDSSQKEQTFNSI